MASMEGRKRNPAYGYWTEEETNWSQRDTDLLEEVRRRNRGRYIPGGLEDLKGLHEELCAKERAAGILGQSGGGPGPSPGS